MIHFHLLLVVFLWTPTSCMGWSGSTNHQNYNYHQKLFKYWKKLDRKGSYNDGDLYQPRNPLLQHTMHNKDQQQTWSKLSYYAVTDQPKDPMQETSTSSYNHFYPNTPKPIKGLSYTMKAKSEEKLERQPPRFPLRPNRTPFPTHPDNRPPSPPKEVYLIRSDALPGSNSPSHEGQRHRHTMTIDGASEATSRLGRAETTGQKSGSEFDEHVVLGIHNQKMAPQPRTEEEELEEPEIESEPAFSFRPSKKHLRKRKLMRLLGDAFDPTWMSVDTPERDRTEEAIGETESRPTGRNKYVRQQGMKRMTESLKETLRANDVNPEKKEVAKVLNVLQTWFSSFGVCPVYRTWKRLSEFYWPRWIRVGQCSPPLQAPSGFRQDKHLSNSPRAEKASYASTFDYPPSLLQPIESSCSWPPGMRCLPSPDVKTVYLLRWHCHRQIVRRTSASASFYKPRTKLRCRWLKVPYNVTDQCQCAV